MNVIQLKISTIIPVYNAQHFIKKAVESALQFDEVTEIILIEDGSKDNSYELCRELETTNRKIKLYRHPNGSNKGAGASRNLGISKSTGDYISFLDADDYYLSNRFDAERKIFSENQNADGVYGALGVFFYSDEAKNKFKKVFSNNQPPDNFLTTISSDVKPEELFENLSGIKKNSGYFHLDCLTIKSSSLKKLDYCFNEKLKLHQDTEFIIRLSYHMNIVSGNIKNQIAKRGVHDFNRITQVDVHSLQYNLNKYKLFCSIYEWSKNNKLDHKYQEHFKSVKKNYMFNVLLPVNNIASFKKAVSKLFKKYYNIK